MKKIVSLIAMAVLLTAELCAQSYTTWPTPSRDTLSCGRQSNYYYSRWLDTTEYYLQPPWNLWIRSGSNMWGSGAYNEINGCCDNCIYIQRNEVSRPIRIKGLWAMLEHNRRGEDWYYGDVYIVDTNRLPEYLYLYVRDTNVEIPSYEKPNSNFVRRVATVRWDTAQPKMMCIRQDAEGLCYRKYCQVYEALLDTALTLSGELWIGGSSNSTSYGNGLIPGTNISSYHFDHMPSLYRFFYSCDVINTRWSHHIYSEDPDGPWYYCPGGGEYTEFGPFGYILDEQQWLVEVASADSARGFGTPRAFYPDSSYTTIRALAKSCYQFSHWNDGVTDNPRTVFVTQDTTFTAYFDTVSVYNVEVGSNDDSMGYAELLERRPPWDDYHLTQDDLYRDPYDLGILNNYYRRGSDSTYCKGDPAQMRAHARDGYYFWYWNDGIAVNPRFVAVTQDTQFTAIFSQDTPPPTCREVNGLEATVDDDGRVRLTWASGVDVLHVGWEVAWGLDGTPAYQCNTRLCSTATVIDSLEKGQWYVAYVRAICMHDSTEYYSDWSRGVRVYIPLDIKYTVTAEANYEERGYVAGGGVYEEGALATLTAYAVDPYGFLWWNDGATMNPRYVEVTQDTSFTALFVTREGIATADSLGSVFILLPNPASGSVRCVLEGVPFPGGVLTMADASGREVMRKKLLPQTISHTIMLTDYPKGVYFITLTTAEGSSTQKLIVE